MNQPLHHLRTVLRGAALSVVVFGMLTTVGGSADANLARVQRPGRILIIRGLFNVFSLGLDELACQFTQLGYRVDVAPPSMALIVAQQIQDEYLRDPSSGPLVIIGHSMGGRHCCSIPWKWREHNIPVRLVVILDSNPEMPVADNVQRCVNLYVTNNLGAFHGQAVWGVNPRSDLVNMDVTKVSRPPGEPALDHFNIDDSDWIQGMVVREVEYALTPGNDADSISKALPDRQVSAVRRSR